TPGPHVAESSCSGGHGPALNGVLKLALLLASTALTGCANKPSGYPFDVQPLYAIDDPAFVRVGDALLDRPMLAGNKVEALRNGDKIFPSMLDAIRSARQTVVFETYIYWSGDIANQFADALIERVRAGVVVKVLVDALGGSKMSSELIDRMKEGGVDLRFYNAIDLSSLVDANYRTHRKILVVDGRIGFTGGVGIGDKWLGDAASPNEWRDNHYRITGPVVAQLQSAFLDNWVDTTGIVLHGEDYYPKLHETGELLAQVVTSSSEADGSKIQMMLLLALAAAREEVLLATPYFVPDDLTIRELVRVRERGVSVRVIVPGPIIDFELVRRASRSTWRELLEAGIEIWAYQPTMFHCKLVVVDGLWTSVGSANIDNRSFSLNDEVNLNVYDAHFATTQRELFHDDLRQCHRITLQDLEDRAFIDLVLDEISSWFSPQL
ncbi:MAG: cardiolipin synthase B, partial [Planctomycetes bacterium]|nr:cardiolipin synthase B [Planctomycetota bacterium]